MLLFCPQCSNTLTVSRSQSTGTNRLECRTCPYEFVLQAGRKFYERRPMKRKEVDDVMGGEGAWDNVDQTDGTFFSYPEGIRERGWGRMEEEDG